MHHLNAALRAHALYKRDVEYIVRQGEVIIVDEFTAHHAGPALVRRLASSRGSQGRGESSEENQTVASITFQNFFRLVLEIIGHDRYRRYRGVRVPADLWFGSGGHPDP